MSELDVLIQYWKRLESNMERREHLFETGKFVCDGVCDKELTQQDKEHLDSEIVSYKKKSNIVAEKFNEKFDMKFLPFPEHNGKKWNPATKEFE